MWVVITKNQCNFCDSSLALLRGVAGSQVTTYNVQTNSSKWLLTLMKEAGYTTVPQIFKPDGSYLGGYTELKEYLSDSSKKKL
tara:strand:+ start:421 stop:669 length:249 start_codon:yes stop_codon:yes gene_type:complete